MRIRQLKKTGRFRRFPRGAREISDRVGKCLRVSIILKIVEKQNGEPKKKRTIHVSIGIVT